MRLVYGHNDEVATLVAALIEDCERSDFGGCTAIGVADDDRLIGGFVFHNYRPAAQAIEVSFAGATRRWLGRPVLYAAFSYVFDQLGCQLAVARTPARLRHAVRMASAYGFEQVTIPRLFGRHEDAVISTLTAEAWRSNGFHKENAHGQEIGQRPQGARSESNGRGADASEYRHGSRRRDHEPRQPGDA